MGKFYSDADYGAYGRAKEETTRAEAGRFFALAQADAAARERAIAAANEADRFAYQAAARDAQLMEDRNRFELQRALAERDREERRGDTLFNRRLLLSQEGREQARLNLAERKFKADEDAFNKQLELDSKLEGQEGEALARGYMEIVPQLKSLDEQLEGLRDTDELLRKDAVAAGLVVGQKGFGLPSGTGMLDPAKQQALQTKMSEVNVELKRIEDLKKAAQTKQQLLLRDKYALDRSAGRLGAVLTERGLEGRGRIIPFPQVPAAPTAVGGGPPVTEIRRIGNGRLGPVPGATPQPAVARQTDEEFGPSVPPIVARQSAAQGRPSPAYLAREMQGAPSAFEDVSAEVRRRLSPEQQFQANRFALLHYFRQLGLNPYSEPLRIGESSFFKAPLDYMQEFEKTPEFRAWYANLDDSLKARIADSSAVAALGRRKGSLDIERWPYPPDTNFNWRRSDPSEPVYE